MELNQRQQTILQTLHENGKVSVACLAKTLHYSEMTIRRDLTKLETAGFLRRSHGVALEPDVNSLPIVTRSLAQDSEKRLLCKRAARHLTDHMTVFLDSSSTCAHLLPYIAEHRDMKIFTNSVMILLSATQFRIPCYATGGRYYERDMCFLGSQAESYAASLNVDAAFFSFAGYCEDGRVTDDSEEQSAVRLAVIKNAKKKVLLFDSTKKNVTYEFTVCRQEDFDDVILG